MPGSIRKTMDRDRLRRIGVYTGSGGCAQDWTEEQYRFYYEGRQKQCSVYVIPTSTPGTLASEISMRFGSSRTEPYYFHRMHVIDGCDRICGAGD